MTSKPSELMPCPLPNCDLCNKPQSELGALLFWPPENTTGVNRCVKTHICVECLRKLSIHEKSKRPPQSSEPVASRPYSYKRISHDSDGMTHFRIADIEDTCVATCYDETNAWALVELLNRAALTPHQTASEAVVEAPNMDGGWWRYDRDKDEWVRGGAKEAV